MIAIGILPMFLCGMEGEDKLKQLEQGVKNIHYSHHALERMAERHVLPEAVAQVMKEEQPRYHNNRRLYEDDETKVVTDKNASQIITVIKKSSKKDVERERATFRSFLESNRERVETERDKKEARRKQKRRDAIKLSLGS